MKFCLVRDNKGGLLFDHDFPGKMFHKNIDFDNVAT